VTRLALAFILAPAVAFGQAASGLTAAPQLGRVYDAILDARFDDVPSMLGATCPPAPLEVCGLLDVQALWWRIQLDPDNTTGDAEFRRRVDATIAAMEAWTTREPRRAEAWFYLGGAYGARSQHRVLRREVLAAARDGKRIKAALERALVLDPDLQDAYFGIGLYHYYADVAPAAAKFLRFLLLLPGGDREQGLREMLRARDRGQLLRSEADYQLHILYIWYEDAPEQAIALVEQLRRRYPGNPHFPQVIAEIQDTYLHDTTASLRSWQALLALADAGTVREAELAATRARLGIATQLDRLSETDLAIEQLDAVIAANPQAPAGAVARATGLRRAFARKMADPGYRLSIEGWRAFERGDLTAAAAALARSISLRGGDPVTRYRQARLLVAQGNPAAALPILEGIIRDRARTPPTVYADACVDAARIHARDGDTVRAATLYADAATVHGADQRTKAIAQREAARLTSR
jgi:tetratricopeptide (TPR) repeat protein